MPNQI